MPNELPNVPMVVENILDLPSACPVSRNPQPGSRITIRYRPRSLVLEVAALREYIDSYVGGRGEVRSMEAMIQQIAVDCAVSVGVAVTVVAELLIAPEQRMRVECEASTSLE
jgi:NADPH-dependent 7-cyano-7-deazaguanine reductase QueF